MIFESEEFYIDSIENHTIEDICKIYNSDPNFLLNHLGSNQITDTWVLDEIASARKLGFQLCILIEKCSGDKIGILDFKAAEETYLSLLFIHNDFKGRGIGKKVFMNFEKYVTSLNSKCIRIDVVRDYDNSVFNFWRNNGFSGSENIELNWSENILSAITLKKHL